MLQQPIESTELLTERVGTPAGAAEAVAQAWCERERRCERVGAGRAYGTLEECTLSVRARQADELNVVRCERGIDEAALQQCLGALRETGCEPGDEEQVPCVAVALCEPAPAPGPVPPAP